MAQSCRVRAEARVQVRGGRRKQIVWAPLGPPPTTAALHPGRICLAQKSPDPTREPVWSRLPLVAAALEGSEFVFLQDIDSLTILLDTPLDKLLEDSLE